MRITNELSDEIRIQRGVRKGCVASPTLFNLYTDKIFRHVINTQGVNVGGKHYNNLRYADDTALLAGNENELSELTSKINEVGNQFQIKINIKKTKPMVVSKKPNVCGQWVYRRLLNISWTEKITNEEVLRRMGTNREIVRSFNTRKLPYLGHLIRH